MKKTFSTISPNKKPERQLDSIRYEIKKYIARERRKELPEGVDFWDFDCKIGKNEECAEVIHIAEISSKITALVTLENPSFYIEILAKPGVRKYKKDKK